MTILPSKASFPKSNSLATEEVLKPDLCQVIQGLRSQPLTWPLIILLSLLPKNPTQLEKQLQYSEKGRYFWMPLFSNPFGEVLLCFWSVNSDSRSHDHFQSLAFVIVLIGKISQKLLHVSANKLFIFEQQELKELSVGVIPAYQAHRIQNFSQDWAISVHLYFPRRKSIELAIDED
ncbi:hypothetical protein [Argonema antarcticum]|uniref:hypothetical protein n=1 Tax=Argonema antarcticum TaxID=2942763 RepID=UPI002010ED6F|nr:hypothetical protein [Argonema antarcticum]MCL1472931.1 hypothetical protein [Argonema antarcticum A004/B2]